MIYHTSHIRVRYAETDRMGYVYYGNYATFFEVARVETLRSSGITDEIVITTAISQPPTAKLRFHYQTHRGETLLNEAETDLVFVDASTGKPIRCPKDILEKLQPYFD